MTYTEIIYQFLGQRARRFVEAVDVEWLRYTLNPYTHGLTGCLRRDAKRVRLVRLAYHRYSRSTPTWRRVYEPAY